MGKIKNRVDTSGNRKKKESKKSRRPIHQYTKEALRYALFEIREHKMSVRKASITYGVPKTAIHDRLSGRIVEKPRKIGPSPVLSVAEEKA